MADNAAAFAKLDKMLDTLRAMPNLGKMAAPQVAEACKKLSDQHIAAGVDPYGEPWAPSKDGRAVLKNAGKAITAKAIDSVILITLTGVEVMHHIGNARGYKGGSKKLGGFRRTLIPFKALPRDFRNVTREALSEEFQHLVKRGGKWVHK